MTEYSNSQLLTSDMRSFIRHEILNDAEINQINDPLSLNQADLIYASKVKYQRHERRILNKTVARHAVLFPGKTAHSKSYFILTNYNEEYYISELGEQK